MSSLVESFGFEIVAAKWVGNSPRHRLLRIYLDLLPGSETGDPSTFEGGQGSSEPSSSSPGAGADAGSGRGINLEQCARMSRLIGHELDAAEADENSPLAALLATPYTLEVSSPGIERPLVKLSHFQRFLGSPVSVKTHVELQPGSRQRKVHGEISAAEPDPSAPEDPRRGFISIRENDSGTEFRIRLTDISAANLVYVQ